MPEPANNSPPSLSDALERLMANPEIMSTITSAIGNLKAQSEAPAQNTDNVSTDTETQSPPPIPDLSKLISTLSPMLSSLSPTNNEKSSGENKIASTQDNGRREREALLCALKPYVSDGRKEAIDYIIRISQISDILKQVNLKGG